MWKTKVIIALIVSMTADAVTKSGELSLEPYVDGRLSGVRAQRVQVAGGFALAHPAAAPGSLHRRIPELFLALLPEPDKVVVS